MYINAGSVSSSLKSKHRIFFCTLILNVSKYTCFLYNIVPRDTRLGRLYNRVQNVPLKGNLYILREQVHMVCRYSGGGDSIRCLPCPSLNPFVRTFHRKASKHLFVKFDFCSSPKVLIHLHILGTYQQIKVFSFIATEHIYSFQHTHTANQNVYGFVKDDHVVTILFVLTFFRNEHKIQILVAHYFI